MSDVMLFGVLRMPYELAMSDELSRRQFYQRAQEAADRLAALSACPVPAWLPIETAPKDGSPFRGFHEALIDLDFNPQGSVECAWDGERFIGCVWNGEQDAWYGKPVELSHWMPIPAAPTAPAPAQPVITAAQAHAAHCHGCETCQAPAQPAEPSAGLEARILAAIEDLTDFSPAYMTPLAGMVRGGEYVRKPDVVEAIRAAIKEQPAELSADVIRRAAKFLSDRGIHPSDVLAREMFAALKERS